MVPPSEEVEVLWGVLAPLLTPEESPASTEGVEDEEEEWLMWKCGGGSPPLMWCLCLPLPSSCSSSMSSDSEISLRASK
jgi:hypothetical protein